MANKELREWRMKTHAMIDPPWKSGKYARAHIYNVLSSHFGKEIHVGQSDIERCKAIIEIAPKLFSRVVP